MLEAGYKLRSGIMPDCSERNVVFARTRNHLKQSVLRTCGRGFGENLWAKCLVIALLVRRIVKVTIGYPSKFQRLKDLCSEGFVGRLQESRIPTQ